MLSNQISPSIPNNSRTHQNILYRVPIKFVFQNPPGLLLGRADNILRLPWTFFECDIKACATPNVTQTMTCVFNHPLFEEPVRTRSLRWWKCTWPVDFRLGASQTQRESYTVSISRSMRRWFRVKHYTEREPMIIITKTGDLIGFRTSWVIWLISAATPVALFVIT